MDRTILHCDMNGFYASVELLDYPELKNKPMAVCGNPENRHGIILAKNQIAKNYGIVTAETLWQARKIPWRFSGFQVVPPHHDKYRYYSKLINQIYLRFTDMVEPFSVDESWLDVTASQNLFGTGREIADTIRKRSVFYAKIFLCYRHFLYRIPSQSWILCQLPIRLLERQNHHTQKCSRM